MTQEFEKDKLWVTGFARNISDAELESFCNKYGSAIHMHRPMDKSTVFLTYLNEEVAAKALENFRSHRIHSNYARKIGAHRNTSNNNSENGAAGSSNSQSSHVSAEKRSDNGSRRVLQLVDEQLSNQHTSNRQSNSTSENEVQKNDNNSISARVGPFNANFRNGDEVIITHVKTASMVYVRPVSRDHEFLELVKTVSKLAKTSKPLAQLPHRGMLVLAPYKGIYYRGLITNDTSKITDRSEVMVLLVDSGRTTNVSVSLLRTIPEEYTKIAITRSFQLRGLEGHENNSYVMDCLMSYVGTILQLGCDEITNSPRTKVSLFDPRTKQSINELIRQAGLTFSVNKLTRKSAPIGRKQTLMVVDESKLRNGWNLLTFIDEKDSYQFNKQRHRIQAIGNELEKFPPYLPNKEELCLVKFDEFWCRGIFVEKELEMGDAIVLLIDIGKSIEIEEKCLRNITEELVRMPVMSFIGTLKGFNKTIPDAKVNAIIHKFKRNEAICVRSICESAEIGIYMIDM